MIILRKETWGTLSYNTKTHTFKVVVDKHIDEQPYVSHPTLLNIDLTFKCNLVCKHCVARDMENLLGGRETADLKLTDSLIKKINKSPFMVIVVTGGEPLLKEYEESLILFIDSLQKKGIIIDTNGTINPSNKLIDALRKKDVMVRVSWDSPHPLIESQLRAYPKGMYKSNVEYIEKKQDLIKRLIDKGLKVSVQSVMHKKNYRENNFYSLPVKFKELGINRWYIQRYIPTGFFKDDNKYTLTIDDYLTSISNLTKKTKAIGIDCYAKQDRRHNSVFLLVKDGAVYTQSDDKPGEKVYLGKIDEVKQYFEFVSSSEHTVRYIDYPK